MLIYGRIQKHFFFEGRIWIRVNPDPQHWSDLDYVKEFRTCFEFFFSHLLGASFAISLILLSKLKKNTLSIKKISLKTLQPYLENLVNSHFTCYLSYLYFYVKVLLNYLYALLSHPKLNDLSCLNTIFICICISSITLHIYQIISIDNRGVDQQYL